MIQKVQNMNDLVDDSLNKILLENIQELTNAPILTKLEFVQLMMIGEILYRLEKENVN